jgi:hypothetical protein
MLLEVEKAEIMTKLGRGKGNWGAKYDRLEHFKRFSNLDKSIKELGNAGWVLIHKKQGYTGISLNPKYKLEIIEFIEKHLPYLKGMVK